MTTHISIDLGLPDIEVEQVDTDKDGHYHIRGRSTLEGKCRVCGHPLGKFHEYDREICIRHLPTLGKYAFQGEKADNRLFHLDDIRC